MKEPIFTLDGSTEAIEAIATQVLVYLPRIATAILVLILGWLLAWLLRFLLVRGMGRLDQLWQHLVSKRGLEHLQRRHPPVRMIGEVVFWLVLLLFITLATEILGLDIFRTWLREIVNYLPLAIAGLLIVFVGYVVSSLARELVTSAAVSAEMVHDELLGRATQFIILFIAIIIGIDQIGIDIAFLSIIAGISLATMLGGVALAFGLGTRTHVSNIIAANQLRQVYQVGDIVSIGDIKGRILDIMVSRVIIETEAGNVDVPAKLFDEQVTILIEKGL